MKFQDQTKETQQKYLDKAASFITPDMYFCTRVWEAWGVGTMSQDDFEAMEDSDDFIHDLAELLFNVANGG
jgi:hypothetical protein